MIGNKTGNLGEGIAARYLEGKGFHVTHRNYWKSYGEIDIVAEKAGKVHFVEVKAQKGIQPRENYNAAENVHPWKLKKLGRVIQAFLSQKQYQNVDWQFDICIVQIDPYTKKAKVSMISNELLPE